MKVERKEVVLIEMNSADFDSLMFFIKRGCDRIILDDVDIDNAERLYKDLQKANSISG